MRWFMCMIYVGTVLTIRCSRIVEGFKCKWYNETSVTPAKTSIYQLNGNFVANTCLIIGQEEKTYQQAKFACESEFINGRLMSNSTSNVQSVTEHWKKYEIGVRTFWVGESLQKCLAVIKSGMIFPCDSNENTKYWFLCEYPPQDFCAWQKKMHPEVDKIGEKCSARFMVTWQWNDFNHSEQCDKTASVKPGMITEELSKEICNCNGIQWSDWREWSSCKPCENNSSRVIKLPTNCLNSSTIPNETRSCKTVCPLTNTVATSIDSSSKYTGTKNATKTDNGFLPDPGKKKVKDDSSAFLHVFLGFLILTFTLLIIGAICLFIGSKKKHHGPLGLMSKEKMSSPIKRKLQTKTVTIKLEPSTPKSPPVTTKNWSISLSTSKKSRKSEEKTKQSQKSAKL